MPKVIGFNKAKRKRVTCSECTAVVEYVPNEVESRSYTVMGDSSGHQCVKCPHCKAAIVIPGTSW
jgi:cytidine deaminase